MAHDVLTAVSKVLNRGLALPPPFPAAITRMKQAIGVRPCEERDAAGATTVRHFFDRGVQDSGASLFYFRDHLGSVRELTDAASNLQARYDYDPYGRQQRVTGSQDAAFGFAGYFAEVPGFLTRYRAYDPATGRWLSEDPARTDGGVNLYEYGASNPVLLTDPFGLSPWAPCNATDVAQCQVVCGKSFQQLARCESRYFGDVRFAICICSKYGTCGETEHRMLQSCVVAACQAGARACRWSQECSELKPNLLRNELCMAARQALISSCYGGPSGGDPGHQKQLTASERGHPDVPTDDNNEGMQMSSTPEELVSVIEQAFGDATYPGDDNAMVEPGLDPSHREGIAASWRGRPWQDVEPKWLATNGEDALHFMTPAAIRYYMPAFLRGVVLSFDEMDIAVDALVWTLTPPPPSDKFRRSFEAIAGMFTPTQSQAIAAVLEWLLEVHSDDLAFDAQSAGEMHNAIRYWRERAIAHSRSERQR